MPDLVIHRRFLRIESPEYINRYINRHLGAPASEDPASLIAQRLQKTGDEAVYVAWDGGWVLTDFDGWEG